MMSIKPIALPVIILLLVALPVSLEVECAKCSGRGKLSLGTGEELDLKIIDYSYSVVEHSGIGCGPSAIVKLRIEIELMNTAQRPAATYLEIVVLYPSVQPISTVDRELFPIVVPAEVTSHLLEYTFSFGLVLASEKPFLFDVLVRIPQHIDIICPDCKGSGKTPILHSLLVWLRDAGSGEILT